MTLTQADYDRQARYNRRKIAVAILFSTPYLLWVVFVQGPHPVVPRQLAPLVLISFLAVTYPLANALLRWLAKRWP